MQIHSSGIVAAVLHAAPSVSAPPEPESQGTTLARRLHCADGMQIQANNFWHEQLQEQSPATRPHVSALACLEASEVETPSFGRRWTLKRTENPGELTGFQKWQTRCSRQKMYSKE